MASSVRANAASDEQVRAHANSLWDAWDAMVQRKLTPLSTEQPIEAFGWANRSRIYCQNQVQSGDTTGVGIALVLYPHRRLLFFVNQDQLLRACSYLKFYRMLGVSKDRIAVSVCDGKGDVDEDPSVDDADEKEKKKEAAEREFEKRVQAAAGQYRQLHHEFILEADESLRELANWWRVQPKGPSEQLEKPDTATRERWKFVHREYADKARTLVGARARDAKYEFRDLLDQRLTRILTRRHSVIRFSQACQNAPDVLKDYAAVIRPWDSYVEIPSNRVYNAVVNPGYMKMDQKKQDAQMATFVEAFGEVVKDGAVIPAYASRLAAAREDIRQHRERVRQELEPIEFELRNLKTRLESMCGQIARDVPRIREAMSELLTPSTKEVKPQDDPSPDSSKPDGEFRTPLAPGPLLANIQLTLGGRIDPDEVSAVKSTLTEVETRIGAPQRVQDPFRTVRRLWKQCLAGAQGLGPYPLMREGISQRIKELKVPMKLLARVKEHLRSLQQHAGDQQIAMPPQAVSHRDSHGQVQQLDPQQAALSDYVSAQGEWRAARDAEEFAARVAKRKPEIIPLPPEPPDPDRIITVKSVVGLRSAYQTIFPTVEFAYDEIGATTREVRFYLRANGLAATVKASSGPFADGTPWNGDPFPDPRKAVSSFLDKVLTGLPKAGRKRRMIVLIWIRGMNPEERASVATGMKEKRVPRHWRIGDDHLKPLNAWKRNPHHLMTAQLYETLLRFFGELGRRDDALHEFIAVPIGDPVVYDEFNLGDGGALKEEMKHVVAADSNLIEYWNRAESVFKGNRFAQMCFLYQLSRHPDVDLVQMGVRSGATEQLMYLGVPTIYIEEEFSDSGARMASLTRDGALLAATQAPLVEAYKYLAPRADVAEARNKVADAEKKALEAEQRYAERQKSFAAAEQTVEQLSPAEAEKRLADEKKKLIDAENKVPDARSKVADARRNVLESEKCAVMLRSLSGLRKDLERRPDPRILRAKWAGHFGDENGTDVERKAHALCEVILAAYSEAYDDLPSDTEGFADRADYPFFRRLVTANLVGLNHVRSKRALEEFLLRWNPKKDIDPPPLQPEKPEPLEVKKPPETEKPGAQQTEPEGDTFEGVGGMFDGTGPEWERVEAPAPVEKKRDEEAPEQVLDEAEFARIAKGTLKSAEFACLGEYLLEISRHYQAYRESVFD